jgi:hypothetical protein
MGICDIGFDCEDQDEAQRVKASWKIWAYDPVSWANSAMARTWNWALFATRQLP